MENFVEEQVEIRGEVVLKGTMTLPQTQEDRYPALLIINGSGNADRDGNISKPALEANIYKELAHHITRLGFITLRYDKRGVGESGGQAIGVGMKDLLEDVVANVEYLRNHPWVDPHRIIVLGHSEGCILSTLAATRTSVAGLILLGGAGTNLREPTLYQNALITQEIQGLRGIKGVLLRLLITPEKNEKQQRELYERIMDSTEDVIKYRSQTLPAKWFREHYEYRSEDIQGILREIQMPVLAITGEKDVQANPKDIQKIHSLGNKHIQGMIIDNMDHMLKEFIGEITVLNLMKQYKREASQPIHPRLKEVIGDWLNENFLLG